MAKTQDHINISEIKDGLVILKNGDMAVILKTSAVNFGLLSDNEQLAIISSFAGLLNSLSFSIQIVIRSKRLDISSYLRTLDEALLKQTNPLLSEMIKRYHKFIENTVRENEVLDKQFYIVIPLSHLEIGLRSDYKKALAQLLPRRDHMIRQLSRCGLEADQLTDEELVNLFYDIYNQRDLSINLPTTATPQPQVKATVQPTQQPVQPPQTMAPVITPPTLPQTPPQPITIQPAQTQPIRRKPFIVEELPEDYGTA